MCYLCVLYYIHLIIIIITITITIAGQYKLDNATLKGFMNNRREYGLTYETKISPSLGIQFGLATFLDKQSRANTRFGYKLSLS